MPEPTRDIDDEPGKKGLEGSGFGAGMQSDQVAAGKKEGSSSGETPVIGISAGVVEKFPGGGEI
jgi:hypothetical protein